MEVKGHASTWSDRAFSYSGVSIVRWLKSSPLFPVQDASTSAANKEVEKADAQHRKKETYHHYDDEIRAKIAKYSCIYKSLKFIFTKVSMILETLSILAANISRFTVFPVRIPTASIHLQIV